MDFICGLLRGLCAKFNKFINVSQIVSAISSIGTRTYPKAIIFGMEWTKYQQLRHLTLTNDDNRQLFYRPTNNFINQKKKKLNK